MNMTAPEVASITSEEEATVQRFVSVLTDRGFQAMLSIGLVSPQTAAAADFLAKAVGVAAEDVLENSDDLVNAGLSLAVVASAAHEANEGIVPADFLPSEETLQKYVDAFWARQRENA